MLNRDRVAALIFLAFSIAYGVQAMAIPLPGVAAAEAFTARTMPYGLAIAGVVCSFLLLVLPNKGEGQSLGDAFLGLRWGRVGALLVLMVGYGLTIRLLGFLVSTSLFLIIGYALLGERRWTVILGASIPLVVGFWALITQLLGIYLEPGTLWLGFGASS